MRLTLLAACISGSLFAHSAVAGVPFSFAVPISTPLIINAQADGFSSGVAGFAAPSVGAPLPGVSGAGSPGAFQRVLPSPDSFRPRPGIPPARSTAVPRGAPGAYAHNSPRAAQGQLGSTKLPALPPPVTGVRPYQDPSGVIAPRSHQFNPVEIIGPQQGQSGFR